MCEEQILAGEDMTGYFGWAHVGCAVTDCMTRKTHSEGWTYFLRLEGGAVKVGYTAQENGVGRRARSAFLTIGRVEDVIGVVDGGRSLEFAIHYMFKALDEGRPETFHPHRDLLAIANSGSQHEKAAEGRLYLEKNRAKWNEELQAN